VVHNLMEASTFDIMETRIRETQNAYQKLTYHEDTQLWEPKPNSWIPIHHEIHNPECRGTFTVYQSKYFIHVFLVHDPPGKLATLEGEELKRKQHNMRCFEYINLQLTIVTLRAQEFHLISEIRAAAQECMNTYTADFHPKTMEIYYEETGSRPLFSLRLKPPPLAHDIDYKRDSMLFDTDRYWNSAPFNLRHIEFVDNRAISILSLKGTYTEDDKTYFVTVEVPGVTSIEFIQLKRLHLIHQICLIAKRPPLFPYPDDLPSSDYYEYTYVASFSARKPFSKFPSEEDVVRNGSLEDGVFKFELNKVELDDDKEDDHRKK